MMSSKLKAAIADEIARRLTSTGKVTVELDRTLVEGIDEILQERGGSIEAFLELQMVGFVRSKAVLGLDDVMNFGKYTSVPVKHVIANDLAYMFWLVVEQKSKKFKEEVYREVVRLSSAEDFSHFVDMDEIPFR